MIWSTAITGNKIQGWLVCAVRQKSPPGRALSTEKWTSDGRILPRQSETTYPLCVYINPLLFLTFFSFILSFPSGSVRIWMDFALFCPILISFLFFFCPTHSNSTETGAEKVFQEKPTVELSLRMDMVLCKVLQYLCWQRGSFIKWSPTRL